MVNLFELFSIILLFIAFTECGSKQDHIGNNEIHGRRSNKYFKFQPRKENKQAVALFRTSVEQLPCGKNTELPMDPDDIATNPPAETEREPIPDYDQPPQPIPTDSPPTPYDSYDASPAKATPVIYDDGDDSEEAIDLNVNIVITNMPRDDEEFSVEETQNPVHKTIRPQTVRTTKKTKATKKPVVKPRPAPTSKPKPPMVPPRASKPPKHRPTTYDYLSAQDKHDMSSYVEYKGDETTTNDDSAEEIDINVAVIVTEMPEEDDSIDGNTIAERTHYDDVVEMERGADNMAARVATNTLVGLASFFSSFALTNYFFY